MLTYVEKRARFLAKSAKSSPPLQPDLAYPPPLPLRLGGRRHQMSKWRLRSLGFVRPRPRSTGVIIIYTFKHAHLNTLGVGDQRTL